MLGIIVMLACTGSAESGKESDACTEEIVEVQAEVAPGWTPAAGCQSLCAATDEDGRAYLDCYLTTENQPICQYGVICD